MTQAIDTPPDRFARRRQKSREALIQAAIELFQSKGVAGTTLEEICERADVALRTFFNHFETREHLHEAIARERAVQLATLIEAWSGDPRPFPERLAELLAAIGAYLADRPAYREFVGEMLHLRPARGSETVRSGCLGQATRGFVATAVARGEVSERHGPEVLSDLVLGAITITLSNWCADGDYDVVAALAEAGDALLELMTPAP